MSGHSKWSTIKHKKAALDAKKGALFTKIARDIAVAAREGGSGDPDMNFRLRLMIDKARAANMPADNVDRAVKKGLGIGSDGSVFEEIVYEGYSPGGAAIMVKALTDNRNRTASNIRTVFSRGGGNLGEAGAVAWMFESKSLVSVEGLTDEQSENLALSAIDAGAEDFKIDSGLLEITGEPSALESIISVIKESGLELLQAHVTMIPNAIVQLENAHATQALRLLDNIEELEDIQQVFTNADFSEEALEKYGNM